jgi:hypothetical protein
VRDSGLQSGQVTTGGGNTSFAAFVTLPGDGLTLADAAAQRWRMKHEYVQTYQDKTTKPAEPMTVKPPDGNGWELHSWRVDPAKGWLVLIWQRPTVDG